MSPRLAVPQRFERRRVALFLAVAFGVSWATALVIWLTGGLTDSPELVRGVTLANVLLPTAYMFGPAVGTVATRFLTGEGWSDLRLRPETDGTVRYYAAAWFAPAVLVVLGAALYYAAFPQHFDPTMRTFAARLRATAGRPVSVEVVVLVQVVSALTIGTAINAVFAFGEEFGWRGYLLPKLLPLGTRRAVLGQGLIWGVWHWPITAMGYNYGVDYPGFPWSGMLAFLAFTVGTGTFLAWLTVQEGSVWPASIGHGAINAIAGVAMVFVAGSPNPLLGPTPIGLVAGLPWLVLAGWLLWRETPLRPARTNEVGDSADAAGATPTDSEV